LEQNRSHRMGTIVAFQFAFLRFDRSIAAVVGEP